MMVSQNNKISKLANIRAQHPLKLTQLQTRVDVYKYSFLPRTIIQWNALQIPNIDKIDLETFKNPVSNII